MHETAIAQSIFDIVTQTMRAHGITQVARVNLKVGRMAAVVPEHLKICFDMIAHDTQLAGLELNVREEPLGYLCQACGAEFFPQRVALECPACQAPSPTLTQGRAMVIESIETPEE